MATRQALYSDLAVPPGEYLAEVIEELGMTQADLARRMGRPTQAVNEIVLGKKAITSETALQLEMVTSVPAHIWTGLEDEYRLVLARQEEAQQLQQDGGKVDVDLFRAMVKLGWLGSARSTSERARELRKFFGVAALSYVKDAKLSGYAFRIANRDAASSLALAAWLRRAELDTREMRTEPFNPDGLKAAIAELRQTTRRDPQYWLADARRLLAAYGVALVVQPHLPKTYANGAAFWPLPDKAAVVLSLRGAWADIFWFSLFHELGHVLLHGRREPHISIDKADDKVEIEANLFAANQLVPRAKYEEFVLNGDFSVAAVKAFADLVVVAPGVIVGRLHHESHVPHNRLNSLREKVDFRSWGVEPLTATPKPARHA